MGEKRDFKQWVQYIGGKLWNVLCRIGSFLKNNRRYFFELRKIIMAIPVVVIMLDLANECRARLPEMVGINLLTNGQFDRLVARETAITACIAVTSICLVFMFLSRKTVYPWLISILSLVLPVLLIVINIFPA